MSFWRSPNTIKGLYREKIESIYLDGFEKGIQSASEFDKKMMMAVKNRAIDQTLDGLEDVVTSRIEEARDKKALQMNIILAKKREFEGKLSSSRNESEKIKYRHYLDTLEWVLSGNRLQKT